jgi:SAM-dependent methyltransferase
MEGYLDQINVRSIVGWAVNDNGLPTKLTAWVNNTAVAHFLPSSPRPELHHLRRTDVGFDIDLGLYLKPGDLVAVTNEQGDHLARSPRRVHSSDWSRADKALYGLRPDMKMLEIGPGWRPLAPRSKGWNSFTVDHGTREELQHKYRTEGPVEDIGPIDFVWKNGPFDTAVPKVHHGTFDAILASHVIEHFPNPLQFFLSAAALLKPDGLISLVVPDKRFMFDFFKSVTLTSDYLSAYHERRTRHSRKTAFDYVAYNVAEGGQIAWSARPVSTFHFMENEPLAAAKGRFDSTIEDESGSYVDYHATIYTPSSFALIMFELGQLGVLPFEIERTFPTFGCEFYVALRRRTPVRLQPEEIKTRRLHLMKNTIRELAHQARWLLDDEGSDPARKYDAVLKQVQNEERARSRLLQKRIKTLESELKAAKDTLSGVLHSKSWRVTAPLRKISEFRK